MSRCLVTGSHGFVGGYLTRLLTEQGHTVRGFDIKAGKDFRDYEVVHTAIDDFRPEKIFHIGGLPFVPESFLDPYRAIDVNIVGSLNILEAVRKIGLKTKIHLCGSSEEYGDVSEITEDAPTHPLSPYAISKLAMDHFGQLYARAYGMHIVVTRTFNHTGPGRGEQYAESSFAKQIAEIEKGKRDVLLHGELNPVRNYTDVRDVVLAYTLAIDLEPGVYNICSDQNVKIEEVLTRLCEMSPHKIPLKTDYSLMRPADFSFSPPDGSKFKKLTGWKPEYKLQLTLEEILGWWRERV